MTQSLVRGERVTLSRVDAFADGVAIKLPGAEPFRLCREVRQGGVGGGEPGGWGGGRQGAWRRGKGRGRPQWLSCRERSLRCSHHPLRRGVL